MKGEGNMYLNTKFYKGNILTLKESDLGHMQMPGYDYSGSPNEAQLHL